MYQLAYSSSCDIDMYVYMFYIVSITKLSVTINFKYFRLKIYILNDCNAPREKK